MKLKFFKKTKGDPFLEATLTEEEKMQRERDPKTAKEVNDTININNANSSIKKENNKETKKEN